MTVRFIVVLVGFISLQSFASMDLEPKVKKNVLILIHSRTGNTLAAANSLKEGLEKNGAISATIKRVSPIGSYFIAEEVTAISFATVDELSNYDAILFGSPVYFYSPAAEMLAFLQSAMELWRNKTLKDKMAYAFFSSNGNGVSSAQATLNASLKALYLDTDTLKNQCTTPTNANANGECLEKVILGLRSERSINTIDLPPVPDPVGLYKPYKIAGNMVYINQIALKNGKIEYPGVIGVDLSDEQAKISTRDTMLNVLAVLNKALKGDLSRVKQVVEISGFFNAKTGYQTHSMLLNEASNVAIELLGETKGAHTRASFGVSSLPMSSPVEIKAIIEIEVNEDITDG